MRFVTLAARTAPSSCMVLTTNIMKCTCCITAASWPILPCFRERLAASTSCGGCVCNQDG
ncbi:hypothetical protein B0H34DRAFT_719587 [Crassisporium funariophilum]|nr:hypothetical protein B0H34DRAFT_719587 [Crassisporium funariophilum]